VGFQHSLRLGALSRDMCLNSTFLWGLMAALSWDKLVSRSRILGVVTYAVGVMTCCRNSFFKFLHTELKQLGRATHRMFELPLCNAKVQHGATQWTPQAPRVTLLICIAEMIIRIVVFLLTVSSEFGNDVCCYRRSLPNRTSRTELEQCW
jgi:hypothetical protein